MKQKAINSRGYSRATRYITTCSQRCHIEAYQVIQKYTDIQRGKGQLSLFLYFLSLNSVFSTAIISLFPTLIKFVVEASFGKFFELLVIGNECSMFLLLFCRLNMDHLSFIFSLLLIVSASSTTFGSAIKASDPNGEVKEN